MTPTAEQGITPGAMLAALAGVVPGGQAGVARAAGLPVRVVRVVVPCSVGIGPDVVARRRLASHPDIPTLPEAGGPRVEMHPWAALVAVAGTPNAVVEQLQRDIVSALGAAEVRSRAEQAGFEITPSTPQALRERPAIDTALYRPLVSEGRIARL